MTRDFDDPGLYQPAGMKPQCTFIVHWHSCRFDAGHSGKHSPGHERSAGATPLDVERLRRVLDHFDVVDYHHDLHGVTLADPATAVAAEYARLAEGTDR